jgi:hypothetical protein
LGGEEKKERKKKKQLLSGSQAKSTFSFLLDRNNQRTEIVKFGMEVGLHHKHTYKSHIKYCMQSKIMNIATVQKSLRLRMTNLK